MDLLPGAGRNDTLYFLLNGDKEKAHEDYSRVQLHSPFYAPLSSRLPSISK